jgi:predicted porin
MKKSLIAVAVAGLFAAPVAMAEVTLSGAINLGIEMGKSSAGSAPGGNSLTRTLLNSNYSHVDLESVDDIGDGNKVIFHYQLIAQPQNATGVNDINRNSFLGVQGGWGAFKMGTNENVYERFMYTADPMDGALGPGGNLMILGTPGGAAFQVGQCGGSGAPLADTCGPTNGQVDFYRRTDNTIWYESPNFGGISFEVDYTLSAHKQNLGGTTIDPTVLSIGGKWAPEGAPFYVDVAYEVHNDMFGANAVANGAVGGTSSKDDGIQVGGGFSFGDIGLHARYEQLKYKTDGSTNGITEYKRDAYWVGVKWNLPSGYVGGELGIANEGKTNVGTVNDTDARMYAIGYFHNLSKQSQLQFIYGRTDNSDQGTYGQAGAPNFGAAGADHDVFHIGIKHTY